MNDRESLSGEHAWVEERLSAYLDDQLGAAERARLENHLDGCARCRGSLESLRWTVSLVRQAPAPVAPRSFVLPIPTSAARIQPRAPARSPVFAFGASLATALVAFLLVAVVGLDAISHLGGGLAATAPVAAPAAPGAPAAASAASAAASESLKPTTIARAPEGAPSQRMPPTPASAPEPLLAPSSGAPAPTSAPRLGVAPIAPPAPQGTPPTGLGGGAPPETTAPDNAVQSAAQPAATAGTKSATPTAPAPAPRATAVEPHAVQTAAPPTAASKAQAQVAASPSPQVPAVLVQTPTAGASEAFRENNGEPGIPLLRVVEIGLFVLTAVLGTIAVVLWRSR